jgi:antitoxin PrlF
MISAAVSVTTINEGTSLHEFSAIVTKRGQVTIPAEVRRLLGVKPLDKVVFRIEGSSVTLAPAPFDLESVYGSVKPSHTPEDYEEIALIAREEKVEHRALPCPNCTLPLAPT